MKCDFEDCQEEGEYYIRVVSCKKHLDMITKKKINVSKELDKIQNDKE